MKKPAYLKKIDWNSYVVWIFAVAAFGFQLWHEARDSDYLGVALDVGVLALFVIIMTVRSRQRRNRDKKIIDATLHSLDEIHKTGQALFRAVSKVGNRQPGADSKILDEFALRFETNDPESVARGFQQVRLFIDYLLEQLGKEGCVGLPFCSNVRTLREWQNLAQTKALRVDTYSEWLGAFVSMIAQNSERVSSPLSQEILTIKQQIASFLKDLAEWQEKASRKSSLQYSNLIEEFSSHAEDVSNLAKTIQGHNKAFRENLGTVAQQFVGISASTEEIHEISEKVRMLSLNAAIEAARAGEAGKGFNVISDEIKKLSLSTQTIVKTISGEIQSMKNSLALVTSRFDDETNLIAHDLGGLQEGLKQYDNRLGNYQNEFEKIVGLITRTSNDINTHIEALAPIFQLQDMTVQETRHIAQVLVEFRAQGQLSAPAPSLEKPLEPQVLIQTRKELLELARSAATTDSELALVQDLAQRWEVQLAQELPKAGKTNIELF